MTAIIEKKIYISIPKMLNFYRFKLLANKVEKYGICKEKLKSRYYVNRMDDWLVVVRKQIWDKWYFITKDEFWTVMNEDVLSDYVINI